MAAANPSDSVDPAQSSTAVDGPSARHVFEFVLDVLDRLVANIDGVVGTVLACNGQLLVTARESQHRGATAQEAGVLHAVATEAADAGDHHCAAGTELSGIA